MKDNEKSVGIAAEIRKLIERSFDEPLGAAEVMQLEQSLSGNTEALELYEDLAHLHAALTSQQQTNEFCAKVLNRELRESSKDGLLRMAPEQLNYFGKLAKTMAAFPMRAAAAVMIIGIFVGCGVGVLAATLGYSPAATKFLPLPWQWGVSNEVVAKIQSTHNVVWLASETPETPPTRGLRIGQQVRIEDGWMQISYRNGTGIILRGPAVFEIRSEHGGKLFSGRLSVTVPTEVSPFHVETKFGRVQVGTGHVGIDVGISVAKQQIRVFAIDGMGPAAPIAQCVSNTGITQELAPGECVYFDHTGALRNRELTSADEFPVLMPQSKPDRFTGDVIPLGNLFDDGTTTSLSEAVQSDQYQAAAETTDLGVAAVHDGKLDVDVRLAEDGVLFNFLNVGGGGPMVAGLPSNDTYRSVSEVPIRTTGSAGFLKPSSVKIEEGIGISSNELLTFDLDEIRRAGGLGELPMRFISDKAGINDIDILQLHSPKYKEANANLIVIVSSNDRVLAAYLNGEQTKITRHANVFGIHVDEDVATQGLHTDGKFVTFDVPLPVEAKYLSLVATMLEYEHHDHVVFSGARIELDTQGPGDRKKVE